MRKLLLGGLAALALAMPPGNAETIVIQNATIMTVSQGTVKGSVVVKDGKIAEVGEKVLVPQGATVIDASGQYVIPGIIDCHSHIAVDGSVNEGSVSVSSMVNIKDVIDPEDIAIYRALAGGVTTANILHGSANAIGGQTIVLKMRWGKDAQSLIFEGAMPGIKFALGENPKRAGNPQGGRGAAPTVPARYPATRMGVEDTIREAFNEAKAYKAEWDAYDARAARGEHPIPPRKDLKLEALKEVLEGKRYVHAHCYRADEILMLLRVADDYGFKIRTLQHVLEGYKVAKEIAAHGAGGSTFSDWCQLQDGGGRRHSVQCGPNAEEGRGGQPEQRRCRADAAPEHRGGQGHEVRRRERIRGAGHGDLEPGQTTWNRQPSGFDRRRQGRRPGDLRQVPAFRLRQGAEGADRRHGLLRPRQGSERPAGIYAIETEIKFFIDGYG